MSGKTRGHCETCAWWAANLVLEHGQSECRRHAPRAGQRRPSDAGAVTVWPMTDENDWCGDWTEEDAHAP